VVTAVFLLALGVRVLYLFQIRGTPLTDVLLIDSETYDRMARAILAGRYRGEEVYAMNPLYPYFLAAIDALAGRGIGGVLAVQAVLGAAAAAMTGAIAGRLFGRIAAWIAGVAAALYGPSIFYCGALLTPTLITALILASLCVLLLREEPPGARRGGIAGALLGLAALGRGSNALLVPALLPGFLLDAPGPRRGWLRWGALAGAAALIVGGMSLRNALVEGKFVPIAGNYAAFYIGHNPKATGLYAMPDFVESARFEGEVLGAQKEISARVGKDLSLAETSSYLFRQGLSYALGHPGEELRLAAVKLYYALNRTESPTNLNYAFARDYSPLLRFLPLTFGLIAPWGAAGIVLSRRRARELVPLYAVLGVTLATCVVFFVSAEYRMPAVPVLLVFGGWTTAWTVARVRALLGRRAADAGEAGTGTLVLAAVVLVAVAAAGNIQDGRLRFQGLKRVDYLDFGILYRDRGDLVDARRMLERSLAIDPRFGPAYAALAEVARREGKAEEAVRLANLARRYRLPGEALPEGGRGSTLADSLLATSARYRKGEYREALAEFEALRGKVREAHDPRLNESLLNNIGLCRYKLGDLDGASAAYLEILASDSTYVKAYTNLGLVLLAEGKKEEARARFLRALALDPGNRSATRELERLEGKP
jgi:tetratricopeptide (TPR) repeat protein